MSPEEMDKPLHITQHQCALPRGARRIGRFRDGDIVPINDDDADETEFLELGHPPRNRVELRISEWSLDLDERGAADDRVQERRDEGIGGLGSARCGGWAGNGNRVGEDV
jgi:hypothetical protein